MNKRLLPVIGFALVFSAAASLVVYKLVAGRFAAQPESRRVLVAARDLTVGTLLKDSDVRLVESTGPSPAGAVLKKEDAVGRGVVANIYADEPLVDTRLAQTGAGAGLASTIPVGKRAVAVHVNEVVGVSGFAVPGMRVDVLIMGEMPGRASELGTQTRTILQNIEVLSAGQNIEKNAEGKPVSVQVVNLLVTPEEAEVLSLASTSARVQLVLRNPLDTGEAQPPGTALAYLLGNAPLPKPNAAQPKRDGGKAPKHGSKRAQPKPPVDGKLEPSPPLPRPAEPVLVEVFRGAQRETVKVAPPLAAQ